MKNKFEIISIIFALTAITGCGEKKCEHEWGEYVGPSEYTCASSRTYVRVCKKCGEKDKTNRCILKYHDYDAAPDLDRVSTCSEKGIKGSKRCVVCGKEKLGQETPYDSDNHTWVSIEKVLPTDESDGYIKFECSGCKITKTVILYK